MSLAERVYRCRDCRLGPRDARLGWSAAESANLWLITPGAHVRGTVVNGRAFPLTLEVVPCPAHTAELEAVA